MTGRYTGPTNTTSTIPGINTGGQIRDYADNEALKGAVVLACFNPLCPAIPFSGTRITVCPLSNASASAVGWF
jgi:hypothetical protein